MINKRIQTVFFFVVLLSLTLTSCLKPDTGGPNKEGNKVPELVKPLPIVTAAPTIEVPTATPAPPELPFYQYVPGGEFTMGSKPDDPLAKEDEFPQHAVRLAGYWIFTNEVTNELYAECVAAGECTLPATSDTGPKSHYNDPLFKKNPVVGVIWNQADTFCKYMDAHLPTEAEWEKSARGFFANTYPWGSTEADCSLANINGCVKDTAKVATYEDGKSPFEVRDMAGNVREWVNDWYQTDAYQTAILFMPLGPETGKMKVVRGGSYLDSSRDARSSARFAYDPELEFDDVGFRCVPNSLTYAPFCSTSYRNFCRPPRLGDPPDDCYPFNLQNEPIGIKTSISCPQNGSLTITVTTTEPAGDVIWNGIPCTPVSATQFTCQVLATETDIGTTIEGTVCANETGNVFDPNFGLHLVNCENISIPISIGDMITMTETDASPFLLAGTGFITRQLPDPGCPTGYTWDPQKKECVQDGGPTGDVPPGTEGMCPEGYVLDPNLLCCVPGTEDNGGCEPGYYHTLVADICIPIQENGCPAGWTYDPYLGCMQPVHQGEETPGCPEGMHLMPDGKTCEVDHQGGNLYFTCPPGQMYVQGQGCVAIDIGTPPVLCKEGYYYDYNLEICVGFTQDGCPAGTYYDQALQQCLPTTGPWTGCPQGYMLNPKTGCCVPVPGTDNSDCLGDPQNLTALYDPAQSDCPPPQDIQCGPGYHENQDGYCAPNEECPPGTGATPNNPNGCYPQGTEPCPQGFEMSTGGLGCVPVMMDGIQYQCAPSQYFDPYMGICLDRTDDCCVQGYYFDVQFNQCLPFPVDQNCPQGYTFDGQSCLPYVQQYSNCISFSMVVPSCGCPDGFIWNATKQKCVKIDKCPYPGANVCAKYTSPNQCAAACCRWVIPPTGGGTCQ